MPIAEQSIRKPSRVYLRRGHPLTRGLVGCWPTFAGAGSTIRDISGRQNHLTATNADWQVGPHGPVFDFDEGDSDHAAGTVPNLDTFSVACWFQTDVDFPRTGGNNNAAIHSKTDGSDGYFIGDWRDGGVLRFGTTNGNIQGSTDINTDTWYRLWIVQEAAGQAYIYLDGEEDASGDAGYAGYVDTEFTLAEASGSTSRYFDGQIADVRWYNRAVSPGEIAYDYEHPLAPYIVRPR